MNLDYRQLRCLVAVVDHGGFTGAAAELGVSQPAVSRVIAGLERELGVRLLHRNSRILAPTAAGERVLVRARRLITDLEDMVRDARSGLATLRIGHAWAAMGSHTVEFQRRWAKNHPDVDVQLVRTNTPTGGLAERRCDIAIIRHGEGTASADARFEDVVVGLEARYCVVAADDPIARRRRLRLGDLAGRTIAVNLPTGTTTPDLWPPSNRPATEETHEVDDWLDVIASGRCVGVTAESTTAQYQRQGVVFRRLLDAPPVTVRLTWWRNEKPPVTADVVGLLAELYGGR